MVPIKFAENGIILEESNYKINQYEHSYFKDPDGSIVSKGKLVMAKSWFVAIF
jgi:hypothetical protein